MSVFVTIAFGAGLVYYALAPLGEAASAAPACRDAQAGLDAALGEILDLEADLETGKIAREDYLAARAEAEARAAASLGRGAR